MAAACKGSRYGHRDATMVVVAYRHGLRASEVRDLQWHQSGRARQQEARHQGAAGVARASKHSAHGAIHGTGAEPV
jgi:hypothetical protein